MSRFATLDRRVGRVLLGASAFSGTLVLFVAVFLLVEARPALAEIGARFATDGSWHPAPDAESGSFLLLPMVAGTLLVTLVAVALATPLGVLLAVFRNEVAPPRVGRALHGVLGVLAGIPSVVYGAWGLTVLVPLVRRLAPPGPSLLAGGLVLAVMILPTVALLADAALAAVSSDLRRAAAALGMSLRRSVTGVLLPAAGPGIGTGVVLAGARALGETMAVLMVCGNVVQVPGSLFDPVRTLTANIALEMAYALGHHRAALYASGLALLIAVAVLVALTHRLQGAPDG